MPTFECRVQLQYKHPNDGNYRVLTPVMDTTADITESAGSVTVSVLYHDFTGTIYSIPSGVQSMEVTVWIRRTNSDGRWVNSGTLDITSLRALQSQLNASASGYLEVFGTVSTPVSVTLSDVTLDSLSYYRFVLEVSATSSSYNTDAGRQYFAMTATATGSVQALFEPVIVEYFNGRAYVTANRYGTPYKWEMVNCNGIWYPLKRNVYVGSGYVEMMMMYGLWAFLYVSGLGKFRVKVANYDFGYF